MFVRYLHHFDKVAVRSHQILPCKVANLQWITQRFDSTKLSERKPFRKFGAIQPCFAVLTVTKRCGSMAPKFLKENPSENLVLSNRPCSLSVFAMERTAAQRFDSTQSSERKQFRKFGAIEPPFAVLSFGTANRSKFCQPILGQNLLRLYLHQETANRNKFCQPIVSQSLLRLTCSWLYPNQETANRSKFCQPNFKQNLLRLTSLWLYLHQETANRSKFCQPIVSQNLLRLTCSWLYPNQETTNRSKCCQPIFRQNLLRFTSSWLHLHQETAN